MGFLKDMRRSSKEMKETLGAVPEMVRNAQEAAAGRVAAARAQEQQMRDAAAAAAAQGGADWEPIAGVSLDLYAEISKGLAAYGYDQSKAPEIAAGHGVDSSSWQQALDGWNARMRTNPTVAQRFNALYTGRA